MRKRGIIEGFYQVFVHFATLPGIMMSGRMVGRGVKAVPFNGCIKGSTGRFIGRHLCYKSSGCFWL